MHIAWLHLGTLQQHGSHFHSDIASVRYRVLAPAAQLAAHGHDICFYAAEPTTNLIRQPLPEKPDVVIACKALINGALQEQLANWNVPVIFDVCDPLIENSPFADRYRYWAQQATAITCNTSEMAILMNQYSPKPIHVIPDPCLSRQSAPKPFRGKYQAVWYGHPSNLKGLHVGALALKEKPLSNPLKLKVLSLFSPEILQTIARLQNIVQAAVEFQLIPWSLTAQTQALAEASLVWIPQEDSPRTRTKSSNRLVEALWAGCMVAASPLPSYLPYGDFAFLSENQAEALHQAFSGADSWVPRILAGQSHIEAHDSVFAAGKAWENALQAVHSAAK